MPDNPKQIEKELDEVDNTENPHTGKPHGKPKTGREQQRRDNFEQLWGDEGGSSDDDDSGGSEDNAEGDGSSNEGG